MTSNQDPNVADSREKSTKRVGYVAGDCIKQRGGLGASIVSTDNLHRRRVYRRIPDRLELSIRDLDIDCLCLCDGQVIETTQTRIIEYVTLGTRRGFWRYCVGVCCGEAISLFIIRCKLVDFSRENPVICGIIFKKKYIYHIIIISLFIMSTRMTSIGAL